MSWRDQKNAARLAVHRTFEYPVRCRMGDSSVIATTARIHTKRLKTGDLESQGWAEREEIEPRAVFLVADLDPEDKMIIVTEHNDAWFVDHVMPPDDLTVTCVMTRLARSRFVTNGLDPNQAYGGLVAT